MNKGGKKMATKDFKRLCDLTAEEIDVDRVSNPVLSGILKRVTTGDYEGSFVFFRRKDHTDYSEHDDYTHYGGHCDMIRHTDYCSDE